MKKLLSLLFTAMSLGALAQVNVIIDIDNGSMPIPGNAVLLFENGSGVGPSGAIVRPETFTQIEYTSGNGRANFTIPSTVDTVYYGTFDCNGNFYQGTRIISPGQSAVGDTFTLPCSSTFCDFVMRAGQTATGISAEVFALRDSLWGGWNGLFDNNFYVNNSVYPGSHSADGNYSSVQIPGSALTTGPVWIEFSRHDSLCPRTFGDSLWYNGGTPTLNCNASFFIDTVNSGTFQGQLIIGENSTTSSGTIVDYLWDFGDGTIYNVQYPTHTYASVAATYQLCLTITALDGSDTCVSTYCDSVQFDMNGNPVFKSGFTVNVVDPNTFSVEDPLLASIVMFPNPTRGVAKITWDSALDVERVDVLTIGGQAMSTIEPTQSEVEISSLPSGVYMIRIQTAQSVTTERLIVE